MTYPGTDVIESGPARTPRRTAAVLVLVAVAAATGYLIGNRNLTTATPAPPSATAAGQPVAATGRRCAVQLGARLQLGTEVVNRSAATVTLHRVRAVLPLPGLRPAAPVWGGCGELPPAAGGDTALPAGATAWSTITFDVLVACPRPIPVRFAVDYTRAGGAGTVELPGFADLGDVAYTGC